MEDRGIWKPRALRRAIADDRLADCCYVVVDEVVGHAATVSVDAWPHVDGKGRVRFPARDQHVEFAVPCAELRRALYDPGAKRQPRPGDAFAVDVPVALVRERVTEYCRRHQVPTGADVLWVEPVDVLFPPGSAHDISPIARTAAKLAYYGAMTTGLHRSQVVEWNLRGTVDNR